MLAVVNFINRIAIGDNVTAIKHEFLIRYMDETIQLIC